MPVDFFLLSARACCRFVISGHPHCLEPPALCTSGATFCLFQCQKLIDVLAGPVPIPCFTIGAQVSRRPCCGLTWWLCTTRPGCCVSRSARHICKRSPVTTDAARDSWWKDLHQVLRSVANGLALFRVGDWKTRFDVERAVALESMFSLRRTQFPAIPGTFLRLLTCGCLPLLVSATWVSMILGMPPEARPRLVLIMLASPAVVRLRPVMHGS